MKDKSLLIIMLVVLSCSLNAQEKAQTSNNIRVSVGLSLTTPAYVYSNECDYPIPSERSCLRESLDLEWSKKVTSWLELGLYTGIKDGTRKLYQVHSISGQDTNVMAWSLQTRIALQLGVTFRVHLLELAGLQPNHWDCYLMGRAGSWFANGAFADFGAGAGVSYCPFRNIGLFVENNWGAFQSSLYGDLKKSGSQLNAGIVVKW